ncbi:hypothetical protein ACWD4L_39450 [Streptomyces sp. NPDC002596]
MQQDSEYVYVPVPRRFVAEVQAYVVRLASTGAEEPAGPEATRQWTVELLRQFAQTQLSSTQRVSRLLDELAEQPGKHVSTTHLVELLDIDRMQLRGALSALTRHLNKHFDSRHWPMTWVEQLSPSAEYKTEFFYTVNEDTARMWKAARASS